MRRRKQNKRNKTFIQKQLVEKSQNILLEKNAAEIKEDIDQYVEHRIKESWLAKILRWIKKRAGVAD